MTSKLNVPKEYWVIETRLRTGWTWTSQGLYVRRGDALEQIRDLIEDSPNFKRRNFRTAKYSLRRLQ